MTVTSSPPSVACPLCMALDIRPVSAARHKKQSFFCHGCSSNFQLLRPAARRGRPSGGGRWGAYQGKLKRVYVPELMADNLADFVQSVVELVDDFDYLTSTFSDSPRKKVARQMVDQLKTIKKLIE